MEAKKTKGAWTFTYYSDGHYHDVTITADNLNDAVDIFAANFGEETSFKVTDAK
jgi:hypothetical protein